MQKIVISKEVYWLGELLEHSDRLKSYYESRGLEYSYDIYLTENMNYKLFYKVYEKRQNI